MATKLLNGTGGFSVIDNGAAGCICTMTSTATTGCSSWTGESDGLNFDNALPWTSVSNGSTNPTAGNQSIPDFVALQATITASILGSGRVLYKNPS